MISWIDYEFIRIPFGLCNSSYTSQEIRVSWSHHRKWNDPISTKAIQSFLSLTGHFQKLSSQYATIARLLYNLLWGGVKYEFGSSQEQSFDELKASMAQHPVFKICRMGAETELHTESCKIGFGTILSQKELENNLLHPVYFPSWKTSREKELFTSHELEISAVDQALQKFKLYLLNISIKFVADCRAFFQTI